MEKYKPPAFIRGVYPAFLRQAEVLYLLRIGQSKFYQLVREGKLRICKEPGAISARGSNAYITFGSVRAYVESLGGDIDDILPKHSNHIKIEDLIGDAND